MSTFISHLTTEGILFYALTLDSRDEFLSRVANVQNASQYLLNKMEHKITIPKLTRALIKLMSKENKELQTKE